MAPRCEGTLGKRRLTVAEFLDQWHEQKKCEGLKITTITALRTGVNYLRKTLGEKSLGSVTLQDASAYRDFLIGKGLAKATLVRRIRHARHAFADAVRL